MAHRYSIGRERQTKIAHDLRTVMMVSEGLRVVVTRKEGGLKPRHIRRPKFNVFLCLHRLVHRSPPLVGCLPRFLYVPILVSFQYRGTIVQRLWKIAWSIPGSSPASRPSMESMEASIS